MNLFTYGTLMHGECRGGLLEPCGARFLGEATLSYTRLFELSTGAFPVAMPSRFEEDFVTGELYEIDDSIVFTEAERILDKHLSAFKELAK